MNDKPFLFINKVVAEKTGKLARNDLSYYLIDAKTRKMQAVIILLM